MEPQGCSLIAAGNAKCIATQQTVWQFLKMLNILSLCNSAVMLLGIYPTGQNLYPHKNVHVKAYNHFIHNHPKVEATKMPSIGEWINALWCIQWNITQREKGAVEP